MPQDDFAIVRKELCELARIDCAVMPTPALFALSRIEADNARMKEALKPFAALADAVELPEPNPEEYGAVPDDEAIAPEYSLEATFGDCRRARAALTGASHG